jgi:hypothetical protein
MKQKIKGKLESLVERIVEKEIERQRHNVKGIGQLHNWHALVVLVA